MPSIATTLSGAYNLLVTPQSIISTASLFLDPALFQPAMVIIANVAIANLGGAYASKIVLPPLPANYQAEVTFVLLFPAAIGITISIHPFLEGNAEIFSFISDGAGISANATVAYNGTAWSPVSTNWNE